MNEEELYYKKLERLEKMRIERLKWILKIQPPTTLRIKKELEKVKNDIPWDARD